MSARRPGFDGDQVAALKTDQGQDDRAASAQRPLLPARGRGVRGRQHIPNAELRVIPGVYGHFAGGGANPDDIKFIDDVLKELLAS